VITFYDKIFQTLFTSKLIQNKINQFNLPNLSLTKEDLTKELN
jgi:hypothetical protein